MKVFKVFILTEDNESLFDGEDILLDLQINHGVFKKHVFQKGYAMIECKFMDKEINVSTCPNPEEKEEITKITDCHARKITQEEYDLIKEYDTNNYIHDCQKANIDYSDYEFDSNMDSFLVFDISENYKRILHTTLTIEENKSGSKIIDNITMFYSIRDGVIIEEDDHQFIDDFEIDISEIKKLL